MSRALSATTVSRLELRYEQLGGDPDTLAMMRSRYGSEIENVDEILKDCVDFAARKPVSTITGLLVTRCREAAARAGHQVPRTAAERLEQAERGAAFACQLYQVIAEQNPPPNRIADLLEEAQRGGIAINPLIVDRLRTFGTTWPRPS